MPITSLCCPVIVIHFPVRALSEQESVVVVTDLFGHGEAVRVGDGREFLLPQLVAGLLVFPQVQLGAHQDDGRAGTMVADLRVPLHRQQQQHHHLRSGYSALWFRAPGHRVVKHVQGVQVDYQVEEVLRVKLLCHGTSGWTLMSMGRCFQGST